MEQLLATSLVQGGRYVIKGVAAEIRQATNNLRDNIRAALPMAFPFHIDVDGNKQYEDCLIGLEKIACSTELMAKLREVYNDASDDSSSTGGRFHHKEGGMCSGDGINRGWKVHAQAIAQLHRMHCAWLAPSTGTGCASILHFVA